MADSTPEPERIAEILREIIALSQTVGTSSGRAIDELVTETFARGADRRARSNRVWSRADVRLRAHGEKRCFRQTDSRLGQEIFSAGQKLSAELRTVRRRFSFALSG